MSKVWSKHFSHIRLESSNHVSKIYFNIDQKPCLYYFHHWKYHQFPLGKLIYVFFCAPITFRRSKIPVTLIFTSTLKTNLIMKRGMAAEIDQYCFKLTANELKIDQSTILPIYFRFDLKTILNPNQNLNCEYYSPLQKSIWPK